MTIETTLKITVLTKEALIYNYYTENPNPFPTSFIVTNFTHEPHDYNNIKFTTPPGYWVDSFIKIELNNSQDNTDYLGIYTVVKLDDYNNYVATRDINKTVLMDAFNISNDCNYLYWNNIPLIENNIKQGLLSLNMLNNKFYDIFGYISTTQLINYIGEPIGLYDTKHIDSITFNFSESNSRGCIYMCIEDKVNLTQYILNIVKTFNPISTVEQGYYALLGLDTALFWIGTEAFTKQYNFNGFFPGPPAGESDYKYQSTINYISGSTTWKIPYINPQKQFRYIARFELPNINLNSLAYYNPYLFNTPINERMIDGITAKGEIQLAAINCVFVNGFTGYMFDMVNQLVGSIDFGPEIILPSKNELAILKYNSKLSYNTSMNAINNKNYMNNFNQQMEWRKKANTLPGAVDNIANALMGSVVGAGMAAGIAVQGLNVTSGVGLEFIKRTTNQKYEAERIKYNQNKTAIESDKNILNENTKANYNINMSEMSIYPAGVNQEGYDLLYWDFESYGTTGGNNYIHINYYPDREYYYNLPNAILPKQATYDNNNELYLLSDKSINYIQIANNHITYKIIMDNVYNKFRGVPPFSGYTLIEIGTILYNLLTQGQYIYYDKYKEVNE